MPHQHFIAVCKDCGKEYVFSAENLEEAKLNLKDINEQLGYEKYGLKIEIAMP